MTTHTWTPTDRDRLIYKWVKFDGQKQSWVAQQLDLNQSTVSRIIDRYERWIAHGGPAQQGALNRDERLRAQVWLTFERNEAMIAACLRMADEMERLSDTTKSTTKHYCSEPSREIEVKTENSIRDRSDKACRYIRLANRIGKDQIHLLEKYNLTPLEPFTLDPNEYSQAQADARSGFQSQNTPFESIAASGEREASASRYDDTPVGHESPAPAPEFASGSQGPPREPNTPRLPPREPTYDSTFGTNLPSLSADLPTPPLPRPPVSRPTDDCDSPNPLPSAPAPSASPLLLHTTHNLQPNESTVTPTVPIISVEIAADKKPAVHAYHLPQIPPETTERSKPILDASAYQPPPPIRILPFHIPIAQ